jgi:hypothetical protein
VRSFSAPHTDCSGRHSELVTQASAGLTALLEVLISFAPHLALLPCEELLYFVRFGLRDVMTSVRRNVVEQLLRPMDQCFLDYG